MLTAGTQLAAFQILSHIGAGGMGEVYRARDTRLERDVAIKILPQHFSENEQAIKRFEREAKSLAALSHPNILCVFDIGKHSLSQRSYDWLFIITQNRAATFSGSRLFSWISFPNEGIKHGH